MKFKEFMGHVAMAPANAFSGLTSLILGSYQRTKGGRIKTDDETGEKLENWSLLYILTTAAHIGIEGIKRAGVAVAEFVSEHKKAIAAAAWISLLAAGAVALTLFLWPAALAAVASFSIGGLSIAAIAGPSALAQIGLAAGLTAAAASVATYVSAAVVKGVSALIDFCKGCRKSSQSSLVSEVTSEVDSRPTHGQFRGLNTGNTRGGLTVVSELPPTHHQSPLAKTTARREDSEPTVDLTSTSKLTAS